MLEKIKKIFDNIFKSKNQQYLDAPKEQVKNVNDIRQIEEISQIGIVDKIDEIDEMSQIDIGSNTEQRRSFDLTDQVVVVNEIEQRILKLQNDLRSGIITEEDLSSEDINSLTKLYEKQILETKKSIEKYKQQIISIKSEI